MLHQVALSFLVHMAHQVALLFQEHMAPQVALLFLEVMALALKIEVLEHHLVCIHQTGGQGQEKDTQHMAILSKELQVMCLLVYSSLTVIECSNICYNGQVARKTYILSTYVSRKKLIFL